MITGWCVVELMGHIRHVGEVYEVEFAGSKLGAVDVLERDGARVTKYFGASSVYAITPTTEEAAREMMKPYEPRRLDVRHDDYATDYESSVDATFVPRPADKDWSAELAAFDTSDERCVRFRAWTGPRGHVEWISQGPLKCETEYLVEARAGDEFERFKTKTDNRGAVKWDADDSLLSRLTEYDFVALEVGS